MPPPADSGNVSLPVKPLVMVSPEMLATMFEPTWNTRLAALPSTARLPGPGPMMLTLFVTNNSPLVNKMVPERPDASIVSPSDAHASAPRNEPGPLSAVVVTMVHGTTGCTSNAPISVPSPPGAFGIEGSSDVRTKPGPRWSLGEPERFLPLSIAGLPGNSAWVKVGPPLSCNGPSIGLVLIWSPAA